MKPHPARTQAASAVRPSRWRWSGLAIAIPLLASPASAQSVPVPPAQTQTPPVADDDVLLPLPSAAEPQRSAPLEGASLPATGAPVSLAEHMRQRRRLRRLFGSLAPELTPWDEAMATSQDWSRAAFVFANIFWWSYVASLVTGGIAKPCGSVCGPNADDLGWLLVPAVGPFISAAVLGDKAGDAGRAVLLADGIMQSVGAAGWLVATIMAGRTRPPDKALTASSNSSFHVAPAVFPGGGGLGVVGSF